MKRGRGLWPGNEVCYVVEKHDVSIQQGFGFGCQSEFNWCGFGSLRHWLRASRSVRVSSQAQLFNSSLYFPIIPAFFSLTEFLNKWSIILHAHFLSHLSESESDKHLPDLFWHSSVTKCKYWQHCEIGPQLLSLFLLEGMSTGTTVMQIKTNLFSFLNVFRRETQLWRNSYYTSALQQATMLVKRMLCCQWEKNSIFEANLP